MLLASLLLPYLSHFCSNYTQLACLHWLGAGSAVLRVGVRVVLDHVTGGCAGSSCSQGAAGCVLGRSAPLSTSTLCLAGREARGGAQGSQFSPGAGSRTQLALSQGCAVQVGCAGAEQRGGVTWWRRELHSIFPQPPEIQQGLWAHGGCRTCAPVWG